MDAYGQQIKNVSDATEKMDSVNLKQLMSAEASLVSALSVVSSGISVSISSLSVEITSTVSAINSDISDIYDDIDGIISSISSLSNSLCVVSSDISASIRSISTEITSTVSTISSKIQNDINLSVDSLSVEDISLWASWPTISVITRIGESKGKITISTAPLTEAMVVGLTNDLGNLSNAMSSIRSEIQTDINLSVNSLSVEDVNLLTGETVSVITHIGESKGKIAVSAKTLTEEMVDGLASDLENLSNAVSTKIFIQQDESVSYTSAYDDLSVIKIQKPDYEQRLIDEKLISNAIYVVSSDVLDAFGERIVNVADGTSVSDAVNVGQLKSVSSDVVGVSNQVSGLADRITSCENDISLAKSKIKELSVALSLEISSEVARLDSDITKKVWIGSLSADEMVGRNSDLSIVKIGSDEYRRRVVDGQISSLSNVLFEVSSESINAYGEQIKNVKYATDDGDAVNYAQLTSANRDMTNILSGYPNLLSIDFDRIEISGLARMVKFIFQKLGGYSEGETGG